MKNLEKVSKRLIERQRRQKGITLTTLVITIIILTILIFTIAVNFGPYYEERKRADFESDIKSLKEEVAQQYAKYKDDAFFLTGKSDKYIEPRYYQEIYKEILKTKFLILFFPQFS